MTADVEWLESIWRRALAPEPQLKVSEWADQFRMLPDTAAEPGKWRTSRTEYLREIMDCLSVSSPYEKIVFMKSAQIGATECGLNFIGYIIANAPGTVLFVSPTDNASRRNCRLRLDPLIDSTPELARLVTRRRSRQAGNTESAKTFPGGMLALVGANSAVGLRSTPARFVILDEIDAYPANADNEGDPVSLAIARTQTFRGRKKCFLISTPTIEHLSRIDAAYKEGDQRKFFVPCPHCRTLQALEWCQISWPENDRARAFYVCEHCGESINERNKSSMVAQGKWLVTAQGDNKTASFHLNALYSPFISWGEIAVDHAACSKDPARLQVWTNTVLAECWEDRASILPEPARLMARASNWGELVPEPVRALTCGVDVQMDRLELEVAGWGAGEESWSLEYHVLVGNPAEPDVWQRLDELLLQRRMHRTRGPMKIMATCIDSGNWSKFVYDFTGPRFYRRVFAIKGSSDPRTPIWPRRPARPRDRQSALFLAGVTAAKEITVARFSIENPGPGYCHFPADREFEYYEQLLSEKPIRKFVNGVPQRIWVKSPSARNEALDCRIYNLVSLHALRSLGFNLDRPPPDPAKPQRTMAGYANLGS